MGRGARIFLLSLLISTCVFGLISFVIISSVKDRAEPASTSGDGAGVRLPDALKGESFNLLFVCTEDSGELLSCVLLRVDRERGELTFTPICARTTINDTDLLSVYRENGIQSLCDGVFSLTGIRAGYYTVITASSLSQFADNVGNLRFTVNESMTVGGISFENGTRMLTGNEASTLLRYDTDKRYREESAADILRSVYERLSKTDGADVYTSLCAYSVTTFTKDDFAARRELVSVYAQMKKSTVYLSGTHKGEGESRYFIADTEANLDKFSNYRKYYN